MKIQKSTDVAELRQEIAALQREIWTLRCASGAALSKEQAAAYLNVSPRTFEALVSSNKIPVVRISPRVRRFLREHLDTFLRSRVQKR